MTIPLRPSDGSPTLDVLNGSGGNAGWPADPLDPTRAWLPPASCRSALFATTPGLRMLAKGLRMPADCCCWGCSWPLGAASLGRLRPARGDAERSSRGAAPSPAAAPPCPDVLLVRERVRCDSSRRPPAPPVLELLLARDRPSSIIAGTGGTTSQPAADEETGTPAGDDSSGVAAASAAAAAAATAGASLLEEAVWSTTNAG